MLERAQECIKRHIPDTNTPIVIAVSGGVDSMMLLQLLSQMRYTCVTVAHINHCLRSEADQDEAFVKVQTEALGYSFASTKKNVRTEATRTKTSIEQAGRTIRYAFLEEQRNKHKAQWILLAHHKDDLAESQLLHLQRGSDLFGLIGFTEQDTRRHLLRPFIYQSKEEILKAAHTNALLWKEDSTNTDTRYKRNYIRHELIPKLKSQFPNFLENMHDLSIQTISILAALYTTIEGTLGIRFETENTWYLTDFLSLTPEQQSYALLWILRHHAPFSTYTQATIQSRVAQLPHLISGKKLQITRTFFLERTYNQLRILRESIAHIETQVFSSLPASIQLPSLTIHLQITKNPLGNIVAPLSLLKEGCLVRSRQVGDKVAQQKNGFVYHKSLKKVLSEHQVPIDRRDSIPLLISNKTGEIVAIISNDIYYRHPMTSTTTDLVYIHLS